MPYRNEVRALQARVARLEAELAEARVRLQTARDTETPTAGWVQGLIGGPIALRFERVIEGEIDEAGLEQIVATVRRELDDIGRIDRVGRTLAYSTSGRQGRLVELTCEVRDGRTHLRVSESLRNLIGTMFGGLGGGLGGGGMGLVVPLIIEFGSLYVVPLWLIGVFVLVRSLYRSRSRRRHAQLEQLTDRIEQGAREHLQGTTALRVDGAAPLEADAESELDAHHAAAEATAERAADEEAEAQREADEEAHEAVAHRRG